MDNVTLRKLERTHPGKAAELFEKIRNIGGFGDVDPNHEGGLDIKGLPESTQNRILELLERESAEEDKTKGAAAEVKAADKASADKKPADKNK